MKPIRRTLAAIPKVLSAKDRTCEYIASDKTVDSYNEIVRPQGWLGKRFQLNSPVCDSHDYSTILNLLGNVTAWGIANDAYFNRVQFIPEKTSELGDFAWKMTETGFLRAVSVGFMPVVVRAKYRDPKDFAAACAEMKLTPEEAAQCDCIHWQQDQTELSLVLIGANPSAVALAHKSGAVTDADMASIGFDDDGLQFLHDGARAFTPEALKDARLAASRKAIRHELHRIIGDKFSSNTGTQAPGTTKGTAPVPGQRSADRAGALEALRSLGAKA